MSYKNIEELTLSFYPTKEEMEREALKKFVYMTRFQTKYVDVSNVLIRNGIYSISDLHNVSVNEIEKFRNVGDKKKEVILDLKEIITKMLKSEES